jgi:hypothetical protein
MRGYPGYRAGELRLSLHIVLERAAHQLLHHHHVRTLVEYAKQRHDCGVCACGWPGENESGNYQASVYVRFLTCGVHDQAGIWIYMHDAFTHAYMHISECMLTSMHAHVNMQRACEYIQARWL